MDMYIFGINIQKCIKHMSEIIDSDWLKFQPIKIGLKLRNFEKSKKNQNFWKILRSSQFFIFSKIVHCEFFG
jgi:hypothetical protein